MCKFCYKANYGKMSALFLWGFALCTIDVYHDNKKIFRSVFFFKLKKNKIYHSKNFTLNMKVFIYYFILFIYIISLNICHSSNVREEFFNASVNRDLLDYWFVIGKYYFFVNVFISKRAISLNSILLFKDYIFSGKILNYFN
jgi:hypothetical protein